MKFERNFSTESLLVIGIDVLLVIGLWLFACGVEKIPGYRNSMDFI